MLNTRNKQCKSENSNRPHQTTNRVPQLIGLGKKSDPFLKQLRQAFDKQNINPNVKQVRIKSYNSKIDTKPDHLSPHKKPLASKNRTLNHMNNAHPQNRTVKQPQQIGSNSKFSQSIQIHKLSNNHKNYNRKSTEKDQPIISNFLQEYCSTKQQRRDKKMKVTLKDIKKNRKSIQQTQAEYAAKMGEEMRQNLSREVHSSLKNQNGKNEQTMTDTLKISLQQVHANTIPLINEYKCLIHPQKKASHLLLDGTSQKIAYCQKCSVNFVTKGYKMIQLSELQNKSTSRDDIKQKRLERLKNFFFDVNKLEPVFQQTRVDLNSYKKLINQKYKQEQNRLNLYYRRIQQQIQVSYEKTIFNLNVFYNSVFEELDHNQKNIDENYLQIQTIKEDILPRINSIIEQNQVNQRSFQEIIEKYKHNLKTIELKITQITRANYIYYEYNYDKNRYLISEMQNIMSPTIQEQKIINILESGRKNTTMNSQKKIEFFRMSFGKEVQSPTFKQI